MALCAVSSAAPRRFARSRQLSALHDMHQVWLPGLRALAGLDAPAADAVVDVGPEGAERGWRRTDAPLPFDHKVFERWLHDAATWEAASMLGDRAVSPGGFPRLWPLRLIEDCPSPNTVSARARARASLRARLCFF